MAAFIAPLITGLAGLFGGGKQQSTAGSQTTSGTQSTSSSTTPNLSPTQQALSKLFSQQATNFATTAPDLSGYTQGGLENINNSNSGAQSATRNMLAARGLAFSPAAATATEIGDQNRQNQQSQFLSQIPLLQRQLQQQGIGTLEQAFSTVPVGNNTQGTQSSQGTTNQTGTVSGNPLAGLFSGVGAGLFAPNSNGGQGSNLGAILASLGFGGGGGAATPQFNPGSGPGYGYGPITSGIAG